MSPRLKSLTIKNFRTILGNVVIPLDAQVVLVHGANGMGKTSVLSALELGLTGKIAHLESKPRYTDFFTNFSSNAGSIDLVLEHLPKNQSLTKGTVSFSPGSFESTPALSSMHASFFSERCFLPQAVLGRLLDIYDEQNKNTGSRLTQFVKELLRLEPLDALADGLSPAFNVTRVRKIAPAYKQLEALLDNYEIQKGKLKESIDSTSTAINSRLQRLNEILSKLFVDPSKLELGFAIDTLRAQVANSEGERTAISQARQLQSQVISLRARLDAIGSGSPDADIAEKERAEAQLNAQYAAWRDGSGAKIEEALKDFQRYNADLTASIGNSTNIVDETVQWCDTESNRCVKVLEQHKDANEKLSLARGVVQRASTRIREINEHLESGARDARTLANALAGVVPHVDGETCPVCSRDYNEIGGGTLTSHIAEKIANLTTQAGRLQAFAAERASESQILAIAQRDLVVLERGALEPNTLLGWQQRHSAVLSIRARLHALREESYLGQQILVALNRARQDLSKIREARQSSATLLPEIHATVEKITGFPTTKYATLHEGLQQAALTIEQLANSNEMRLSLRAIFSSEADQYQQEIETLAGRKEQHQLIKKKIEAIKKTVGEINEVRDTAKLVATAATGVRSRIVRDVFSGSLNAAWRDLFVRLAPSEQFIPQFQLPSNDDGRVEAVLETLHKSGQIGGTPGAMLSQGNLNTAALTLFLALHLSVPSDLPWLILDDPVQSMDDVHVAQFAALLRTLSKGLGKQLIVAVHERALFEYLTLELSPAFAGDSLLAVEISRSFDGQTIAEPRYYDFEVDKAIAA
jgi:exonuclease SbcC